MEDIIDLGSITVPDSWEKVTLKQFQEIERYYSDKDATFNVIDVLDILIDKDKDYIMSLPAEFLDIILSKLSFLSVQPEIDNPTNKIVIDGVEYHIDIQSKLKTGEYVAVDTVMKADKHNLAAVLAILCRKDGELYDSKFENEILDDRITLFEQQPMVHIFPLLSFFLSCYIASGTLSQSYLKVEEALNLTQMHIDSLEKIGVFKKLYLNWQMKKLRKSLKSTKHI